MKIDRKKFEHIVREENKRVLKALPPDLREKARQVTIVIADTPTREEKGPEGDDLLGIYEGISLTDRHVDDMEAVGDQITLFRIPFLEMCDTTAELREEVRITIIHELGHYFGFDDGELEKRGL